MKKLKEAAPRKLKVTVSLGMTDIVVKVPLDPDDSDYDGIAQSVLDSEVSVSWEVISGD